MSKTNIKIGSVITPDLVDVAYISLNSIKQNKKSTTKIDYYLFIKYSFTLDEYYCRRYLDELISDDFKIHYIDANPYIEKINPQKGFSDVLFIRCLFPKIFDKFDKIIHLDIDVFCLREGIEDFWNTDIEDYYVGACISGNITWNPQCCKDYYNTQTKNYFNAGVMLMNLKKIREDGLDDVLEKWTKEWDFNIIQCWLHDQTLLNYFFREHVKVLSPIWNNKFVGATVQSKQYLDYNLSLYGFDDPIASLDKTVFVHFITQIKPWKKAEMARGEKVYPYVKTIEKLWNELITKYGKKV